MSHGFANLVPWIAVIITLGGTRIAGDMECTAPPKGLIAAAREEDLPAQLRETNSNDVPKNFPQAIVVSALSFAFLFMPSVNSAYWFFMVLLTQLYLIMYLLLFGAAVKLRNMRIADISAIQRAGRDQRNVDFWDHRISEFCLRSWSLLLSAVSNSRRASVYLYFIAGRRDRGDSLSRLQKSECRRTPALN